MIKQEFKRIFVKILVRIIILFLFLIVCYIMGSSNVKADTLPVTSEMHVSSMVNNWNTINNPSTIYYLGWNWYRNTPNQQSSDNSAWIWNIDNIENFNTYKDKQVNITFLLHFSGDSSTLYRRSFFGRLGGSSADSNIMCELSELRNFSDYNYYGSPNGTMQPSGNSKYIVMKCNNFKITENGFNLQIRSDAGITSSSFDLRNVMQVNINTDYSIDQQTQATKETNEHLKSQDTSGAQNGGSSFFDNFQNPISSSGLSGIVGAPITLLQNLLTGTCTPLHLNIPFVNKEFDLPCMSTIYEQNFGTFLQVYRIITFGIITYWVIIKCIGIVKNLVDPDDDKIEVLDL